MVSLCTTVAYTVALHFPSPPTRCQRSLLLPEFRLCTVCPSVRTASTFLRRFWYCPNSDRVTLGTASTSLRRFRYSLDSDSASTTLFPNSDCVTLGMASTPAESELNFPKFAEVYFAEVRKPPGTVQNRHYASYKFPLQ
jgi:hypothetical protein